MSNSDFTYKDNEYQVQTDAGDFITAKKVWTEAKLSLTALKKDLDLPKGTPVMVRDYDNDQWLLRYFVEFSANGRIRTVLTPCSYSYHENVLPWQQWRHCTNEEFPHPIYNWRPCPTYQPEWLGIDEQVRIKQHNGAEYEAFVGILGVYCYAPFSTHINYNKIKFIAKL